MSTYARQIRLPALMVAVALIWGCATKQRPTAPTPPPPTAATPEATPTPSPTPQETQTGQQAQAPGQGTPPPEPAPSPTPAAAEKKAKVAKQHPPKKSPTPAAPAQTAKNNPPKKVGNPDSDLASGQISPADNAIARGEPTTEQLLQSTENSLNNLKRQLSSDEQIEVTHIRDFINQSRQATKESDASRAHNLAWKAHLMCDDLVNRK